MIAPTRLAVDPRDAEFADRERQLDLRERSLVDRERRLMTREARTRLAEARLADLNAMITVKEWRVNELDRDLRHRGIVAA
jgi:hypothetical protein